MRSELGCLANAGSGREERAVLDGGFATLSARSRPLIPRTVVWQRRGRCWLAGAGLGPGGCGRGSERTGRAASSAPGSVLRHGGDICLPGPSTSPPVSLSLQRGLNPGYAFLLLFMHACMHACTVRVLRPVQHLALGQAGNVRRGARAHVLSRGGCPDRLAAEPCLVTL